MNTPTKIPHRNACANPLNEIIQFSPSWRNGHKGFFGNNLHLIFIG